MQTYVTAVWLDWKVWLCGSCVLWLQVLTAILSHCVLFPLRLSVWSQCFKLMLLRFLFDMCCFHFSEEKNDFFFNRTLFFFNELIKECNSSFLRKKMILTAFENYICIFQSYWFEHFLIFFSNVFKNWASIDLNSTGVNHKLVYGCFWAIEQSNYIVTKQCSQHTTARLDNVNINIYKMLSSLIVKL